MKFTIMSIIALLGMMSFSANVFVGVNSNSVITTHPGFVPSNGIATVSAVNASNAAQNVAIASNQVAIASNEASIVAAVDALNASNAAQNVVLNNSLTNITGTGIIVTRVNSKVVNIAVSGSNTNSAEYVEALLDSHKIDPLAHGQAITDTVNGIIGATLPAGVVPTNRTITVNGISHELSSNVVFSIQAGGVSGDTNLWNSVSNKVELTDLTNAISAHNTNETAHLNLASLTYVTQQISQAVGGYLPTSTVFVAVETDPVWSAASGSVAYVSALGTAAYSNASAFATASQGAKADTALQVESDTFNTVLARGNTTSVDIVFSKPFNQTMQRSDDSGYIKINGGSGSQNNGAMFYVYGKNTGNGITAFMPTSGAPFKVVYINEPGTFAIGKYAVDCGGKLVTNGIFSGSGSNLTDITAAQVGAYPLIGNPSNWVTASITNGLWRYGDSVTNAVDNTLRVLAVTNNHATPVILKELYSSTNYFIRPDGITNTIVVSTNNQMQIWAGTNIAISIATNGNIGVNGNALIQSNLTVYGTITGNGSGLTNVLSAVQTNNVTSIIYSNPAVFIGTNQLPSLTNGFVGTSITNGLATTGYVNNVVSGSTNGLWRYGDSVTNAVDNTLRSSAITNNHNAAVSFKSTLSVDGTFYGSAIANKFSINNNNINLTGFNGMTFNGGGNEWMRIINTNGYIGIATTNPAERLHVNGNALIQSNLTVYGTITGNTYIVTSTNPPAEDECITTAYLEQQLQKFQGFVYYGTTNAVTAPWTGPANMLQFSTTPPGAWTNTFTSLGTTPTLVGFRIFTNVHNGGVVAAGSYTHYVNARVSASVGNPIVSYRSDLVLYDGATTQTLAQGSSVDASAAVQELSSSCYMVSNVTMTSSQRFGVARYAWRTGGSSADIQIFGGDGHASAPTQRRTRLEGPALQYSATVDSLTIANAGGLTNRHTGVTLTNLTVGGIFSANNMDSSHPVYDLGSTVVNSTSTITRAMGSHLGIQMASNTTFVIDWSTFPTNQYASFSMCLNPMNYTATFGTGLSNSLSLTASNWHTLIFVKGCYWSKFLGRGNSQL